MNQYNNDISDYISEYIESEFYFMLDPSCKEYMEAFLYNFLNEAKKSEDFPESWNPYQMKTTFRSVAKLMNVPVEIKKYFTYMLGEFLEFLNNTARLSAAGLWIDWLESFKSEYIDFFRDDGSVKGESIKFEVEKVKRNDPCPCGSGKKYKKCCGSKKNKLS